MSGNGTGISVNSGSGGTYTENSFSSNTSYGLNYSGTTPLTATNNNWGDPSGPLDDSDDRASGGLYNPNGKGNKVSNKVNYYPWIGSTISQPTTPTGLSSSPSNNAVTLKWNPITSTDLGYKIYYGTTSGTYTTPVNVGNVSSYKLTGLANGTTYYIAISSVNNIGAESTKSTEISVVPIDIAISGRVTNSAGEGIAGVWVYAYEAVSGSYYNTGISQVDGSYTITGLSTGSFKVQFVSNGSGYFVQWYNNKSSQELADAVTVTAGATTSNIDATMILGGSITGRVTDASGAAILDAIVVAYDSNNTGGPNVSYAKTDADGNYNLQGLPTGNYRVEFDGTGSGFFRQYYNNSPDMAGSAPVSVTVSKATTGVNASLVKGASISGVVTNSSGAGIQGVFVTDYDVNNNWAAYTITDVSGNYLIQALPTGSYKLRYQGVSGYLTQWYSNRASSELADAVSVTAGNTTPGINATLVLGGTISGKVSNEAGVGIAGVSVGAFGSYAYGTSTESDGSYVIAGLPAGNYNLQFYGNDAGYISQWYSNKTSQELADAVTVTAGNITHVINATMVLGGTITGKVTDSTGAGRGNVQIRVYDAANPNGSPVVYALTDSTGLYSAGGLATGNYKLQFYGNDTGYISQWYSNKASQTLADVVAVTSGNTTPGINATLVLGGTITGKVTNASGVAIAGAYRVFISVIDATGNDLGMYIFPLTNGNYTIAGLPEGSYKLRFNRNGTEYLTQWYNNKTSQALADAVTVTAGATTSGINATMVLGSTISGKVSNSAGVGIAGGYVLAYDATSGSYITQSSTQSDGSYTISGLPVGSYKLQFSGNNTGYINQWYNNKTSQTLADAVTVTSGNTTPDINATMIMGCSITGKVTNSSGVGIAGVYISVIDTNGNDLGMYIWPLSDGNYTIAGLPAGSYKLRFNSNGTEYLTQWYNNKASQALADVVSVTTGSTTSVINTTMILTGGISGTVTNLSGAGISGISVAVFDAATNGSISSASTDIAGFYSVSKLPPGNYVVRFNSTSSSNNYVTVWSNSKPGISTAASVTVTAGNTTSGVSAVLATGGSISGQITDGAAGVTNITVNAYNSFDETVATAATDASGNYSVKGLPDGSYKLRFQERGNSSSYSAIGYVYQVYTNPNINTIYVSKGTFIPVTSTTSVTGINAVLVKGVGSISGTITDAATGAVLTNATARVSDLYGGYLGSATSDTGGAYSVKGIPTGSYKVEFFVSGRYAQQWHADKGDFASATVVEVAAPGNTAAINAALGAGPSIQLPTVIKGYGNVGVGLTSTKTFSVYNYGTADLAIGVLSITGTEFHLLNDRCSGKALPPSSYCTIQVSCTPTSAGEKNETVNIPSNDPETATIGIVVKGTALPTSASLTVDKSGTGGGSVTSLPTGISCGAACSALFAIDASVTLTATPDNGSVFARWNGACTGTGTCQVTIAAAKSVTAVFDLAPVNAVCGTANGKAYEASEFTSLTTADFCSTGLLESLPLAPAPWVCKGINGGSNASCKAYLKSVASILAGSNVVVTPSAPVNLKFTTVTTPGTLQVTSTPGPGVNVVIANGTDYSTVPDTSYEITSTAGTGGMITVCITYNPVTTPVAENLLRLLHNNGIVWEDITTSVDTVNDKVCGQTSSLSPFVIAYLKNMKPGDCDNSGTITIDEVQGAINMYLGLKTPAACVDLNNNGVSIDEVQKVINGYLGL